MSNDSTPHTVHDVLLLIRHKQALEKFNATYQSRKPVMSLMDTIRWTQWSAANYPQPPRLTLEHAVGFAAFRSLSEDSYKRYGHELDEATLLLLLGELAAKSGRSVEALLGTTLNELEVVISPPPPPKAGSKPKYDAAADAAFVQAWERAKAAGVRLKDFCKDRKLTVKAGRAIQARVRMRKK